MVVEYEGKDRDLDLDRIVGQNDAVVLLLRWAYIKDLVPLEYQRANTEADHKGIPPHHATQWIDIVAQHAKIKFWDRVAMKRFHRPELGEPREFSGPKQNQIV